MERKTRKQLQVSFNKPTNNSKEIQVIKEKKKKVNKWNKVKTNLFTNFKKNIAKKKRKDNEENQNSQNESETNFNPDNFSSSQIASTFKEYLKGVKFSSSLQVENPIDLKIFLVRIDIKNH